MNGWWWTSCSEEGWEGFASTREDALRLIAESKYANIDGSPVEIELRPGLDCDDETKPIVFTRPSETIVV